MDLPDLPLFPFEFYCSTITGSLLNCSKGAINCYRSYSSNNYYKYLGVTCQGNNSLYLNFAYILTEKCLHGDIKLSGSGYSSIGRINVCVNGDWGTVCSTSFDHADASVVCAELGFSRFG